MAENLDNQNNTEQSKESDSNYWQSFKELYKDISFTEAKKLEFQKGVEDEFDVDKLPAVSRRKFLALVSASAALAAAGCSDYNGNGKIIPYNTKPEEITLGKPNYYASTYVDNGLDYGILIKTREGRPIKVDGNPDHPVSKGKTSAKAQSAILGLYDPERLQQPLRKTASGNFMKSTWQHVDQEITSSLSNLGGKEISIISSKIISPTTLKVIQDFQQKYSGAKLYSYQLFNEENKNSAWKKCYGSGLFPSIKWNEAKIILALESDFLGTDGNKVESSRMFAERRDTSNLDNFNRLYSIEGNLSLTGLNADYRMRLRPDLQFEFVMSLVHEMSKQGISIGVDPTVLNQYHLYDFAQKNSLYGNVLQLLVGDLIKNKGAAIIYAGRSLPEDVQIAVNLLNEALGNTKLYAQDTVELPNSSLSSTSDLENLVQSMNEGKIGAIINFDTNPVYHLPSDLGFVEAVKKVPLIISLTESENESSELAHYVLPISHAFESWGDAQTRLGYYSMQQPVISPLFYTRQKEEVLLAWVSGNYKENIYHDYLMNYWQSTIYPTLNEMLDFNRFWLGALQRGVVNTSDTPKSIGNFNKAVLANLSENQNKISGYAVLLKEGYATGDGKYANNGWLQELPHPVTKVTWDNYASVSVATAKQMNVEEKDIIEITLEDRKLKIPVVIQPGSADNTITIELGYGRSICGVVGQGVGFNANVLMSKSSAFGPWIYNSASIKKTDETYDIVSTMEHHPIDDPLVSGVVKERKIILEGTVSDYKKNPKFIREQRSMDTATLYNRLDFPGVKWGMSIDLNKCTGCGECVISCNAENNIPVVGKDQVKVSREMQWMRIDRYYSGSAEDPKVSLEPMLCQQCDHAPCENVCPVAATNHSNDGLNQMVYNRCVGTRYCSNNCPYKVRRFNFFNFKDHFRDGYQESNLFDLVYNPEVTVRSRGVMEKCTFCIQRIMEAREDAIRDHKPLKGSDVVTACQEACGTSAINFGDMNDDKSEFYKFRNHELGYYVLENLNVRPNVTYLAKLRNTHTEEV
ncbi:MAG TPA: TAT-variant-translocated molybdopterin oxidoreductase [Ignavibacteriaceae bacterium]|nr:TAT-variant-translocated molybdopterin oxidoreductase [Ignavibacteriaceae bacterium]